MTENEESHNLQSEPQESIQFHKANPKRNFNAHCETTYQKDCEKQSLGEENLKKKHQNFIKQLLISSINQNKNIICQNYNQKDPIKENEKQKQKGIQKIQEKECQKEKQNYLIFDQLNSSTEQESCSVFPSEIFEKKDPEIQNKNNYESYLPIQDLQTPQKASQEQQNQLNESQDENESQEQGSILFIPFQKTEQQILTLKKKQLELIKSYTPLHESQVLPWMNEQIKSIQDPIIRLHQQIISFYNYLRPSKQEHQIRIAIFQQIKSIILSVYSEAKVFPFGSFASGLYLPDGDIDIVALLNHQTSTRLQTKSFYTQIYRQLRTNHRSKFVKITFIASARTPLIKMYHRKTGFNIDISFNTITGLQQIGEVAKISKKYPEFKYLIFVFKVTLKIRRLNETFSGGVGSFLLVCMVYHFLRYFHQNARTHEIPLHSLGDLLLNFLNFYFMNVEFYKQTINLKTGIITSRPRRRNSFSMLSPFDQKIDIGRKAWKMRDILQLFKNRYKLIKQKHFEFGQSLLKQLVNPTMQEFEFYQLKRQNLNCKSQEDGFMEDFIKNLISQIQNTIKKNVIELKPQQQLKKLKPRKYYIVNRKKTLSEGSNDDQQQKQETDSQSY